MNILQITPQIPYPPTDGGKIGIFNITKHLALRGHNITLVAISRDKQQGDLSKLRRYCQLEVVYKNTNNSALGAVTSLFSHVPYNISKYHSRRVEHKLAELITAQRFDIVHIDHLHMAHYGQFVKERFGLPIVLREHNVEMIIMKRFYEEQTNPILKLYAYLQYKKLRRYEPAICERFDMCVMITKDDEARLKHLSAKAKTVVITAGIDTVLSQSMQTIPEEPYSLLLLGPFHWLPSRDGLIWFYRKVFPKVVERCPSVRFYIIGKDVPAEVHTAHHANVIVTGYVPDVKPYIVRSQVCIVPLRIAGGMRIKILELLSMSKAVVSTSIGCEGIEVTDGEHLLVADTEDAFANSIIALFRDEERRRTLGQKGRALMIERYRWETIAEQLEKVYTAVVNRARVRA